MMEQPATASSITSVKLVTLLKRRPDMTMAQFIDRYEQFHAQLGEKVLSGYATRYVRRFMFPLAGDVDAVARPADVITEIWFPDRAALDRCMAHLMDPLIAAEIAEDEELIFDRTQSLASIVEEYETPMPPLAGA